MSSFKPNQNGFLFFGRKREREREKGKEKKKRFTGGGYERENIVNVKI